MTELNLRKVHKNFVCATRAADGHSLLQSAMPAFYSSNHGTAGNDFKLNSSKHLWLLLHCKPLYLVDDSATMHLLKLTIAVSTMLTSHAPTNFGRNTDGLRKAYYFVFNECMVQRPLGGGGDHSCSCGCTVRRKLIKAALQSRACNQHTIIRARQKHVVLVYSVTKLVSSK